MARLLDNLLGHESLAHDFRLAIEQDHLSPVHILFGPSGVGKLQFARGLAQILLCDKGGCGQCASCGRVETWHHEGLLLVEPVNGVLKVDQARQVLDFLALKSWGRRQVVILNEAQLMNVQSANILLKSLEEPPAETFFFLIATSLAAIPLTIRSRAQVHRFRSLELGALRLLSKNEEWIYHASNGSMEQLELLKQPEMQELRTQAFGVLQDRSWENWFQFLSGLSHETSLVVLKLWQQLWRDVAVSKVGGSDLIHQDQRPLIEALRARADEAEMFFSRLVVAEREIKMNMDEDLVMTQIWSGVP